MSRDMSYIRLLCYAANRGKRDNVSVYTYRREVCVARFDELGNAKAFRTWDE